MKKEIESYQDVALLVRWFYKNVKVNSILAPFFAHLSETDWEHHLPQITQFWSDILLGTQLYKGNPMTPHFQLNKKISMKAAHFDEWIRLWIANIEQHFTGDKAQEAIARAQNIKAVMQYKIAQEKN